MKKQLPILLIFAFVFSLIPFNITKAITQNQINAEVQIICTDGMDNWFSGSGTIIDPKGIILTNRHVVEGAYMDICFVGFIRSINQEPDFGTYENPNLAEVKYKTISEDMDAAVLYLDNPSNTSYSYVDIWNSNSNTLNFGDKIEVIGYPSVGGSTITYTSGDFSGFGGLSDGTQNYIKTTAPLEHGNSGGAAYNSSGQFVGIPSMVVPGPLNSLSYILSVNSIKNWLKGILGNNYQQGVEQTQPSIQNNQTNIQNDITPPDINIFKNKKTLFSVYGNNDNGSSLDFITFLEEKISESNSYKNIKIYLKKEDSYYNYNINNLDKESGVKKVYYTYSEKLSDISNKLGQGLTLDYSQTNIPLTNLISLPNPGVYYIGLKFEDNAGNISDSYILAYSYESSYQGLKKISYYSDSGLKNKIGEYNYDLSSQQRLYKWCATSLKTIYAKWEYTEEYNNYLIKLFPANMSMLRATDKDSKNFDLLDKNYYQLSNLDRGQYANKYHGNTICYSGDCSLEGVVSSLLIKPYYSEELAFLEGENNITAYFAYNKNFPFKLACGDVESVDSKSGGTTSILKISNITDNSNGAQQSSNVDMKLSKRVAGKLLLQVEQGGAIWYVDTKEYKRYSVTFTNALPLFRKLSLGITDADLAKIPVAGSNQAGNLSIRNRLKGKLLLQVQQHGEIWYVDHSGYRHSVTWNNLMDLFRKLALGITDENLNKISEGNL